MFWGMLLELGVLIGMRLSGQQSKPCGLLLQLFTDVTVFVNENKYIHIPAMLLLRSSETTVKCAFPRDKTGNIVN